MSKDIKIKTPILVELKKLKPNPWNPNKVFKPEMDLLILSIKKSGFCFPIIVVDNEDGTYTIVDGYHRHLVAKKLKMEKVPVVVLDEPKSELMSATVRFNRARGTHQTVDMSKLVLDLVKEGMTDQEIAINLGMDADEVLRLKQITGLKEAFIDKEFSNSWVEYINKGGE